MLTSFGKVVVTSAGTPVRLTANLAVPSAVLSVNSVLVQALAGNSGNIYIGTDSSMVKATLSKVIGVLAPPTSNSIPVFTATLPYSPGGIDAETIWIDADNSNDGVLGAAVLG